MKWPEEQATEDRRQAYLQSAKLSFDTYKAAPWRRAALASVRRWLDHAVMVARKDGTRARVPSIDMLRDCLREHDLYEAAAAIADGNLQMGLSLAPPLFAEAAGLRFCARPTLTNWLLVGDAIADDLVAHEVLIGLVRERTAKRPGLRDDIREVARSLVRDVNNQTDGATYERNAEAYRLIVERWRAEPNLKDIWFGLRGLQYVTPFRADACIFDLLFETDPDFAAELIEAYNEPFQPALILQLGETNPGRFADWGRLMSLAKPAFDASGAWNGSVLLPLLLMRAADALRGPFAWSNDDRAIANERDTYRQKLAEAVATALLERADGAAAGLRWGGWLFRMTLRDLDADGAAFPERPESRGRSFWLMLNTLARSSASPAWLQARPPDMSADEEFCVEAMRILAAFAHDLAVPGRDLLVEMLPDNPEAYLDGRAAARIRELPGLFVAFGKRPDALGPRVLAAALLDADVVETFRAFWRRTLTLREIAEHSDAFRIDDAWADQSVRTAAETLRFVVALGINLIDYIEDQEQKLAVGDRRAAALGLFALVHDAARELLAIDVVGRRELAAHFDHLCIRRFTYENINERRIAAPLTPVDEPTAGQMLAQRCEISREFFDSLQMLRANGISAERIREALENVGISLRRLVGEARRLNAIEVERRIDLTGFDDV